MGAQRRERCLAAIDSLRDGALGRVPAKDAVIDFRREAHALVLPPLPCLRTSFSSASMGVLCDARGADGGNEVEAVEPSPALDDCATASSPSTLTPSRCRSRLALQPPMLKAVVEAQLQDSSAWSKLPVRSDASG